MFYSEPSFRTFKFPLFFLDLGQEFFVAVLLFFEACFVFNTSLVILFTLPSCLEGRPVLEGGLLLTFLGDLFFDGLHDHHTLV